METQHSLYLYNWRDMVQLGVNVLTSESCAYSMRLLCDVNAAGRELVIDYFGLRPDTVLAESWNSMVNGVPSVGSVMLHRNSLPQLARFALCRAGALAYVVMPDDQTLGVFDADLLTQYEQLQADPARSFDIDIVRNVASGASSIGSRNVRQATGRTDCLSYPPRSKHDAPVCPNHAPQAQPAFDDQRHAQHDPHRVANRLE
jgi:hypothetical protein